MIKSALFALFIALFGVTSSLAHDNRDYYEFLDQHIKYVWTGGAWKTSGFAGKFRIIVTEHGTDPVENRMHIQWLDFSPGKKNTPFIMAERGVVDLNYPASYVFGLPTCNNPPDCNEYLLAAKHGKTGEDVAFKFFLTPTGDISSFERLQTK